jgi:acyl carrier protein
MTNDQLILKLKAIVAPYIQDEAAFKNLNENTDFVNDLKINSANLVDIILDVEDEFEIRLENEDMEKMLDVKSTIEIINTKLSNK